MRTHDKHTPYHERTRPDDEATIYVLKPGSRLGAVIEPGSAIVGSAPPGDRGAVPGTIVIDYCGNTNGADNLHRYEERVINAAGRHFTSYPTVARMHVVPELAGDLVPVGTVNGRYEVSFLGPQAEALVDVVREAYPHQAGTRRMRLA